MATPVEYVEYVCEQIQGVGTLRYRKMFGEYMVYVNEKPLLTICDSTVFVKIIPELDDLMKGAEVGPPYEGAKDRYILDIEDAPFACDVISILEKVTPVPVKKKRKPK